MSVVMRVAVVGAGPAAMYAIETLLETAKTAIEIDVFERLPTPWGLVRAGVAPDHPDKKQVADRLFHYHLNRPEVCFIGNVEVGADISHDELASWYDAVIYAVGATSDAQLGIAGENLAGSWSAREFVAWYNGHPDYQHLKFDLSSQRAVIVGNGNVALDVARILTLPIEQLEKTDIADHALLALRNSAIEEVVILGRRSHWQGAFHNPELEELAALSDVQITMEGHVESRENTPTDWQTQRKLDTLTTLVARKVSSPRKRIVFRFLSSPVEVLGDAKVEQLVVVRNTPELDDNGQQFVRATEQQAVLDTGLVLRAIGYRGVPFPGLPFDDSRGVIENYEGRVTQQGQRVAGVYVTGWIKRGPQGVIGSNKKCARQTVSHLLSDYVLISSTRASSIKPSSIKTPQSREHILAEVAARIPDWVALSGWHSIDRHEKVAGIKSLRPRVKMTNVKQLLTVANG